MKNWIKHVGVGLKNIKKTSFKTEYRYSVLELQTDMEDQKMINDKNVRNRAKYWINKYYPVTVNAASWTTNCNV